MTNASTKKWIESHLYLEGVAAFQALVEGTAADAAPLARRPAWDAYAADLAAGVPLLRSARGGLDVAPEGAVALRAVAARVSAAELPPAIAGPAKALDVASGSRAPPRRPSRGRLRLAREERAGGRRARALPRLDRAAARARAARRGVRALARRGALASGRVPHLRLGADDGNAHPGRRGRGRQLACGCCRTRWTFKRVACPFCANEDANRLGVLELEGEPGLRLDVCEECKGYVKTYTGTRDLELVLSDWPTLHLDVLARERGYERRGASSVRARGQLMAPSG